MKKTLLSFVTALVAIVSCTTKINSRHIPPQVKENEYKNEFFSVTYPSNWVYDVEVNDMSDSIPAMRNGIRVYLTSSNPNDPWQVVVVQKSAMFDVFKTPEEWRDASIQFKQFDKSYIGTVESYMLDSLSFGQWPAAMAGFVAVNETGDTIIHKQMVVMVGMQVYYLNNSFPWHTDSSIELRGDRILESVRFTSKNK